MEKATLETTHHDILRSLSPKTKAALTRKSNSAGIRHLIAHLLAISLTTAIIYFEFPFWPVAVPIQGIFLVFLFTLQHECTHKTPFKSPRLNEFIGHICGVVLLQPFQWFRYFHLAHHRHTNDPARDPELTSGAKPTTWRAYIWHISGLPTWAGLFKTMFNNATNRPPASYIPARVMPKIRLESRLMLCCYVLALWTFFYTPLLFWVWIVPLLLGQPFLRLYLLAEHAHCPHVACILENTRTTFTTRAMRALAWNMPFHIEHHSYPSVPFYRLPALHNEMKDHLITTSSGYKAFTRAYTDRLTAD